MTILLDCDGVIFDFVNAVRHAGSYPSDDHDSQIEVPTPTREEGGGLFDGPRAPLLSRLERDPKFAQMVLPYPGAARFVEMLRGTLYSSEKIIAVTAPFSSPNWHAVREEACKALGIDSVIFCEAREKRRIVGNWLIGDTLATCIDWLCQHEDDDGQAIYLDRGTDKWDPADDKIRASLTQYKRLITIKWPMGDACAEIYPAIVGAIHGSRPRGRELEGLR